MISVRPDTVLRYVLVAVAVANIVVLAVAVASCAGYPYDLDWIEGGMLAEVIHVFSGGPLYADPSIVFTPYIYAPLYVYLTAALSHLTGPGFLTLRLFSLACTLGTLALIYLFVWRETGRHWLSVAACALYAKGFLTSGGELNLARVDHLFILLGVLTAYILRFYESSRAYAAAGAVAALAFLAKQTALVMLAPLAVYAVLYGRKRSAYFTATAVLLSAASYLALNYHYGGWYNYYVFEIPSRHEIVKSMIAGFWTTDVLPFAVAFIVSLVFLYMAASSGDRKRAMFYGMLLCGAVASAWMSRLHRGGMYNVLLTLFPAMSVMFALGIGRVLTGARAVWSYALLAACIAQLGYSITTPLHQLPTEADYRAGAAFLEEVKALDGDVFLPFHNYMAAYAGKRMYANYMAITDVLESGNGETERRLADDIKSAFAGKRFGAIILYPGTIQKDMEKAVMDNYLVARELKFPGARFWPNGNGGPPLYVCVRE